MFFDRVAAKPKGILDSIECFEKKQILHHIISRLICSDFRIGIRSIYLLVLLDEIRCDPTNCLRFTGNSQICYHSDESKKKNMRKLSCFQLLFNRMESIFNRIHFVEWFFFSSFRLTVYYTRIRRNVPTQATSLAFLLDKKILIYYFYHLILI